MALKARSVFAFALMAVAGLFPAASAWAHHGSGESSSAPNGAGLGSGAGYLTPYVVGGDKKTADNVDRIMVGFQHWYADQFNGRTFKIKPAVTVSSEGQMPAFDSSGTKNVQLIFNDKYSPGAGLGGGGQAWVGKSNIDQILKHTIWETQSWLVMVHEVGHAVGLDHVSGTFMQARGGDLSPYDPNWKNKFGANAAQRNALANNPLITTANNSHATDQDVVDALSGKMSSEEVHRLNDPTNKTLPPPPSPPPVVTPPPAPTPTPVPTPTPAPTPTPTPTPKPTPTPVPTPTPTPTPSPTPTPTPTPTPKPPRAPGDPNPWLKTDGIPISPSKSSGKTGVKQPKPPHAPVKSSGKAGN